MQQRRRGATLIEVVGAMMVIASALTLLTTTLAMTATQRRAMSHRRLAVQEAANALERLAASPYKDLTPATAAELKLSAGARRLPDGSLKVEIASTAGETPAGETPAGASSKRIRSVVSWTTAGQPQEVSLVAWRHQHTPPELAPEEEE